MVALNEWMKDIPPETRLDRIIMPGSHDAGLSVVAGKRGLAVLGKKNLILTQDKNILDQLKVGTRFFDLRVYNWGTFKAELYTGHFWEKAGKGVADAGGYGQSLKEVLTQVQTFLEQNKTETVILKFSHMKKETAKKVAKKLLDDYERYLVKAMMPGKIPQDRIRGMRGKIIALFNKSIPVDIQLKYKMKIHSFKAYKPDPKKKKQHKVDKEKDNNRFILWGEYANTSNLKKMYQDQVDKLLFRRDQWPIASKVPHLYQLYWTLTYGNVKENAKLAKEVSKKKWPMFFVSKEIKPFMPHNADLMPNIVVYDFVNEEQNKLIVSQNDNIYID